MAAIMRGFMPSGVTQSILIDPLERGRQDAAQCLLDPSRATWSLFQGPRGHSCGEGTRDILLEGNTRLMFVHRDAPPSYSHNAMSLLQTKKGPHQGAQRRPCLVG